MTGHPTKTFSKRLLSFKSEALLLLIGIAWISLLDFVLQIRAQNLFYPDSGNYLESAQNLYEHAQGHYFRPLLMAAITGIPFLFGGAKEAIFAWSLLVNVSCWLASGILIFKIAKDFVSSKAAFLWALVYYGCIGSAVVNFHLLAESIFTFMLLLSVYYLKLYSDGKQFYFLALSLSLLVLSLLVKPASKFLAIGFGLYFIGTLLRNYRKRAMLMVYASALAVLAQCAILKKQYGDFTISYIDGVTLHNYLCSKAVCLENGETYIQEQNPRADHLAQLAYTDKKKTAFADFKNQLQNNKKNLAKAYVSDVFENTAHGSYAVQDCRNVKQTAYFDFFRTALFEVSKYQNRILTLLGFFFGLWYLRAYKRDLFAAAAGFVILYLITVSGVSCGQGDRFHLVMFPFAILLAAKWIGRFKPRAARPQR